MPEDRVRWGDTTITYRYRFCDRRTLGIAVSPDLAVAVTAPEGTPLKAVRAKVLKRAAWIARARRQFQRFHPLQPPREYLPGETHRYLGRQYRLKAAVGRKARVAMQPGRLVVTLPGRPTPAAIRPLVQGWVRDRAHVIFPQRLFACHSLAKFEGIPLPALSIRTMTRRWGSCSSRGRMVLNIGLITAPRDCIDYVITHELCHLVHHNHGPRFWRLLSRIMPDWRDRKGKLGDLLA